MLVVAGAGYGAYKSGVTPDTLISKVSPTVTQYRVAGDSMSPTFQDGQILLFENPQSEPINRGDIVVAEMPAVWQYASATQGVVVKRVAATEGDTVSVIAGAVHVNGEQITPVQPTCQAGEYQRVLGAGELFVLGDNRSNSLDSLSVLCTGKVEADADVLVHTSAVKAHGKTPVVKG
jgi:signal peptidase I